MQSITTFRSHRTSRRSSLSYLEAHFLSFANISITVGIRIFFHLMQSGKSGSAVDNYFLSRTAKPLDLDEAFKLMAVALCTAKRSALALLHTHFASARLSVGVASFYLNTTSPAGRRRQRFRFLREKDRRPPLNLQLVSQ